MNNTLKRTNDKAYFKYFHCNSAFARSVFSEDSDLVLLQIMKIDNVNFLAEVVKKENM